MQSQTRPPGQPAMYQGRLRFACRPAARNLGANITEFGDAIRWSVTTTAVGGYRDRIVTYLGRRALDLMVGQIALGLAGNGGAANSLAMLESPLRG
jgi:hypothetical protein